MWIIFPRETVKKEEKKLWKEPLGTLALCGKVLLWRQDAISDSTLQVLSRYKGLLLILKFFFF